MSDALGGAGVGLLAGGPVGAAVGGIIGSFFGNNDPTSYYNSKSKAAGYQPGDIAYEGISPKQNSLTQFLRSTEAQNVKQGIQDQQIGQQVFGASLPGQFSAGDAATQVLNYYQALLSGDQAKLGAALQPQIDPISHQFDQIRQMFAENSQRGGGQASSQAAAPYQELQTIAGLKNNAISGAAQGETGAAKTKADIYANIGQQGLSEQQLGQQQSEFGTNTGLQVRAQDFGQQAATQGLAASLVSSLI